MIKYAACFFLCFPVYAQPIGAINPNVTQDNIKQTICVPGWSAKARPPVSYTNRVKIKKVGVLDNLKNYELDHLINLSCGGHPTDLNNLWVQPWNGRYGAKAKDKLEQQLHKEVCNGKITLKECQSIFSGNWQKEYDKRYK